MTKLVWVITLYSATFPVLFHAQDQEPLTFLSGHVYTFEGKPVAHARIEVFPLEKGTSGSLPSAISNDEGAYHLQSPALGETRICARLEAIGYPDKRDKVFASGDEAFPEVELTAGANLKGVDIHLGPPDGFVEGTVVDKKSQGMVRFARITMRWADDPSVMYSSSIPPTGRFQYSLPKRHITLSVSAPGYRTWNYIEPYTHAEFIEVNSIDHKSLKIELEKLLPTTSGRL